MDDQEEFRIYLNAAVASLNEGDQRHLSEAEMVAYYQRRMSAAEHETAQDHLAHCDLCLELLRDTRDFFDPRREDESEVDDLYVRREWKALLAKLPQEEQTTEVGESAAAAAPGRRSFFRVSRSTMALAAGLALTIALNGILTWQLRQERRQNQQAAQNISQLRDEQKEASEQIRRMKEESTSTVERLRLELNKARQARDLISYHDMPPLSDSRSSSRENPKNIPITAKVEVLMLRATIRKPRESSEYSGRVVDEQGKTVLEVRGLKPEAAKGLTLGVPVPRLNDGLYRLELYERTGASEKPLGESWFLLRSI